MTIHSVNPTPQDKPVDFDLDALRKAHADGRRTKTFQAGGRVYEVAGRMPIYVAALFSEGEVRAAVRLWLGDEQEKTFAEEVQPTDADLKDLLEGLYDVTLGESSASAGT